MARAAVRVGIIADIRVFREGLARLLRSLPLVEVTAMGGPELLGHHRSVDACDVLLVEARALLSAAPGLQPDGPRLVAIGARPDNLEGVLRCAEAGALMFVHADATVEEIKNAIGRSGRRAREFIALDDCRAREDTGIGTTNTGSLTPRETEIVELIAQRLSNRQIAHRLGIDLSTVKNHVHSILRKLRVSRRAEAALLTRDCDRRDAIPGGTTTTRSVWAVR